MSVKKRKQLQTKIMSVFGGEMKRLSRDLQRILADDLVTAFLNRKTVFARVESKARSSGVVKRSLNP